VRCWIPRLWDREDHAACGHADGVREVLRSAVRIAGIVRLGCALGGSAVPGIANAQTPGDYLIPIGATWRYLDDGSNPGTAWRATDFADGGWAQGAAELGYGDGDEATLVSCGPSAPACSFANAITTYFRRTFSVSDISAIPQLELRIRRDDGAVAYLNGVEVARSNMPTGNVTSTTPASSAISGSGETAFTAFPLASSTLVNGTNLLAIEIHQSSATSSDISMDASLQVTSSAPASLVRAPYLQNVTPTSAVVRWRTAAPTTTRVRWGLAPAALANTVDLAGTRTEHVVSITGLPTETRIYYSVGSTTQTLAGGDANHYLDLPPLAGQRRPIRIWVTGDHGYCAVSAQGCSDAAAVRNGYTIYAGGDLADLWLMLGDNAYNNGTDAEFTAGQFGVYPTILRNTPFWSAPGNHEFGTGGADSPTQTGPYYDSHSFPAAGEAGGVPSGTEAYYSFDYGNVHVIALDSHDTSRAAPTNPTTNVCAVGQGGAMYQWACADLAATDQDFIVAIWHHPPYTRGGHNSDTEAQLIELRERFLPVMERYGVDLVLTGHSHSYERSVLLDGHYGLSTSYSPALHAVDAGDGDPAGDGAYTKSAIGPSGNSGTIHAVPGNASRVSGGALNHPVMVRSLNVLGSLVIDVVGRQLDARMIGVSGNVLDHFRIVKGPVLPACSDGIDQDGDGRFDFPRDPDCASASDDDELAPLPTCGDERLDAGESCDDGNGASGDGCSSSCQVEACWVCAGEPSNCAPDDAAACDDGLFCSGVEVCSGGSCTSAGDPCTGGGECADLCDEQRDLCADPPGTPCAPDGDVCTDDVCSGSGLCGAPNRAACDDGNACTVADACSAGTCAAGNPLMECASGDGCCPAGCDAGNDEDCAPPPAPAPIPTLGPRAMLGLCVALLASAWWWMRRPRGGRAA
jgi:cysteine-rich repeat protein